MGWDGKNNSFCFFHFSSPPLSLSVSSSTSCPFLSQPTASLLHSLLSPFLIHSLSLSNFSCLSWLQQPHPPFLLSLPCPSILPLSFSTSCTLPPSSLPPSLPCPSLTLSFLLFSLRPSLQKVHSPTKQCDGGGRGGASITGRPPSHVHSWTICYGSQLSYIHDVCTC